jgi:hypothetical protein
MFQYPSSFMTMQGLILLTLSRTSFAAGDGRYRDIRHTHPISVRAIMISTEPLRGTRYSTREEIIGAVGQSLLDINRSGRAEGVKVSSTNLAEGCTHGGGRLY